MSPLFRRLLVFVVSILTLQQAIGALKVGDPAPAVKPASWAQGGEVKNFEGDKVYIVEFWATWCGPCVAVIPHVNDLFKKHEAKGLVVIGQNLGEDSKTVADFVKKMGSKMTYRVAVDDKAGTMGKKWLEAAGQNGIPCAFVVNKQGKIAYIGHPMSLKESLIEELLAAPSTKPAGPAGPAADTATAPDPKAMELARRAANEINAGQLDQAEATIVEVNQALTDKFRYIGGVLDMELLLARKKPGEAVQLANLIAEDYAKSAAVLAMVAERLVSRPDAGAELRDAAVKIATPVSLVEGGPQGRALATLARVAMLRGDKAAAVELQTKALPLAADAAAAKTALDAYQQGRLP